MFGSIWKVEVATGVAVELTHDAKYHSNPDWSPDGKWIIYSADDDARNIQLAIVNVETGRSHELTYDGHVYMDPAFSPDGETGRLHGYESQWDLQPVHPPDPERRLDRSRRCAEQ